MTQVLLELKRNWFGSDGVRYRAEHRGVRQRHLVDVTVAIQAPSDSKVYSEAGAFLGYRKDWSQEAEAAQKRTESLRADVRAARAVAVDAAASVAAADAAHKVETDAEKKKVTAEALKTAKADADGAKKKLDEAVAALQEASEPTKD